jgi:hypothetical protein
MSSRLDVCNLYTGVTYNPGFTVDVAMNHVLHLVSQVHSTI